VSVLGLGIDVVDVARMGRVLAGPRGERLCQRVFTVAERAECDRQPTLRAQRYAARFAAKEAVLKALGRRTRWGFSWPEIEVTRDDAGAPMVALRGRVAERARRLGARRLLVSLSHESTVAVAQAVAESAAE
jgi:holo-[acyl-carrier protein] synthase